MPNSPRGFGAAFGKGFQSSGAFRPGGSRQPNNITAPSNLYSQQMQAPHVGNMWDSAKTRLGANAPMSQNFGQNYGQASQFGNVQPRNPMSRPSSMFGSSQAPERGVTSADFVSEAHMRDYENLARAREEQRQAMEGYMQNMRGVDALGQQGLGQAQLGAQQSNQLGQQGLDALVNQGKDADRVHQQTRGDVSRSLGLAKGEMQKGVDTMQGAIKDHDFFRKDTVSGGVNAIQSQFQSAREQINSNPNMSPEDKQAELRNLDNTMRQQTSSYAAQADAQAAESMLSAKNALSQMQANMGATLGGLGIQGAGLSSSAGMQAAGMNQQALQAGYQLAAAQSQYANSLIQSSIAQAMQARLNGNMAGAQLAQMRPLGAPNLVDSIVGSMLAQGMRPGDRVTGQFAGRTGQAMGMRNFGGFEDQRRNVAKPVSGRPFGGSFSGGAASTFRGPAFG